MSSPHLKPQTYLIEPQGNIEKRKRSMQQRHMRIYGEDT